MFRNVLTAGQQRAYEWLRTARPAAVLILPAARRTASGFDDANVSPTLVYQYAGLRHGLPLVNGSSGFIPAFAETLTGDDSPFARPSTIAPALATLGACGVGYVVVHVHHYRDSSLSARVVEAIRAAPVTSAAQRFDDTWVFALAHTPLDTATLRRRPATPPPDGCGLLEAQPRL